MGWGLRFDEILKLLLDLSNEETIQRKNFVKSQTFFSAEKKLYFLCDFQYTDFGGERNGTKKRILRQIDKLARKAHY